MVTHHYTASLGEEAGMPPPDESLGLAFAMLAQAAGRFRKIAEPPPQDTEDDED